MGLGVADPFDRTVAQHAVAAGLGLGGQLLELRRAGRAEGESQLQPRAAGQLVVATGRRRGQALLQAQRPALPRKGRHACERAFEALAAALLPAARIANAAVRPTHGDGHVAVAAPKHGLLELVLHLR